MANKIFKQRISRSTKIKIAIIAAIILAIIGYCIWDVLTGGPFTQLFNDRERLIEIVQQAGIFGPLAFMLLQTLQTVVAPIPGNFIGMAGGFLFGWWGILWTVLGSAVGYFIVFWLSRRFGRPLVEKIIRKQELDKFDFIAGEHASFVLFMIFLIPGLPDDVVCYLAGLTKVPIKTLMVLVTIGRLPAVVMSNYLGAGLASDNLMPVVVATVACVLALALIIWKKDAIMGYLQRKSGKSDSSTPDAK